MLPWAVMKYLAGILLTGAVCLFIAHRAPVAPPPAPPTPGTDFLKRPIDRTEEVLKQARTRADDPALK